jgi:hypothetical protein
LAERASRVALTGRGEKMVTAAINLGEAAALRLARVDRRWRGRGGALRAALPRRKYREGEKGATVGHGGFYSGVAR